MCPLHSCVRTWYTADVRVQLCRGELAGPSRAERPQLQPAAAAATLNVTAGLSIRQPVAFREQMPPINKKQMSLSAALWRPLPHADKHTQIYRIIILWINRVAAARLV
jgi:hypothetical protein